MVLYSGKHTLTGSEARMAYSSDADQAHVAAALAAGEPGHAKALSARLEAERIARSAGRVRPRLHLVPAARRGDQPLR